MKKSLVPFMMAASALSGTTCFAATPASLSVTSASFDSGQPIPSKFAYCTPDGSGKSKDGGNVNPQLSWSGAPANTKSYVLIVEDPDVPKTFELADKEGKTIPQNFPRQTFYHWVLTDIPASTTSLAEGVNSDKVVASGKLAGKTDYGMNGKNDYSKMMKTAHGGYDGPCPPWNDERIHHYHFIVYALDVPSLNLTNATGADVKKALGNHVLAKGEMFGTYTDKNP